jgi:hypothetical protein
MRLILCQPEAQANRPLFIVRGTSARDNGNCTAAWIRTIKLYLVFSFCGRRGELPSIGTDLIAAVKDYLKSRRCGT